MPEEEDFSGFLTNSTKKIPPTFTTTLEQTIPLCFMKYFGQDSGILKRKFLKAEAVRVQ